MGDEGLYAGVLGFALGVLFVFGLDFVYQKAKGYR